jgi:hypothetical protein
VIILAGTCPGWQVPWQAAKGGYEFVGIPDAAAIRPAGARHAAIFDQAQEKRCADAKERGGLFHRKADRIAGANNQGPFHNTISRSFP